MNPQSLVDLAQSLPRPALVAALRGLRDATLAERPEPDVKIGGADDPYMLRWWLVPRNKFDFNVYLHKFIRSDRDEALHDHPWANLSILIEGSYNEVTPVDPLKPAGERKKTLFHEGSIFLRTDPTYAHRVELLRKREYVNEGRDGYWHAPERPVWTIFVTGPKVREWGFHCPQGWKDWMTFTGQNESDGPVRLYNDVRGCGEVP